MDIKWKGRSQFKFHNFQTRHWRFNLTNGCVFVPGFIFRKTRLNPSMDHFGFYVDKLTRGQVLMRQLQHFKTFKHFSWKITDFELWHCCFVTLLFCETVVLWHCCFVTLLCCDTVVLWHCCVVTVLCCDSVVLLHCCVVTLLCCDTVMLWHCCLVSVLCCDSVVLLHCCVVTLLCCDTVVLWQCCVVTQLCCDTIVLWQCCVVTLLWQMSDLFTVVGLRTGTFEPADPSDLTHSHTKSVNIRFLYPRIWYEETFKPLTLLSHVLCCCLYRHFS